MENMNNLMQVNGKEYRIVKLLGKGKGGYSYLAKRSGEQYVLKQIHHEPCEYYQFGNKIEAEVNDYKRLLDIGIRMPQMIDVDYDNERIVKEYIEGETVETLVKNGADVSAYIKQMQDMCLELYKYNTNIDYYPTNFVVRDEMIYYIDYECNDYMDEWNFENWGIKYWTAQEELILDNCAD